MKNENQLVILPTLDSDAMAESRRRELDVSRGFAADLGNSAVELSRRGSYANAAGEIIDLRAAVLRACEMKVSIPPGSPLPGPVDTFHSETRIQITNETTFGASRRLCDSGLNPLALNFANGLTTGGGVLSGSKAQEEVLCRSSALYLALEGDAMYEAHAKRSLPDSTEWCILSPDVPVFRDDSGAPLDEPWLLSFITCAAPVAHRVGQPLSGDLLNERILRVLAIARAYGYESLVLGAWGCGAFRNDPLRTAMDFRRAIEEDFRGAFSTIVFAITDWSTERRFISPFRDVFEPVPWQRSNRWVDEEVVPIKSRDYWIKVVECLQQNWALIERLPEGRAIVYFIGDTSGVFDQMEFDDVMIAREALRRNGFGRYEHVNEGSKKGIPWPRPPFGKGRHTNGPIYSSGQFWR